MSDINNEVLEILKALEMKLENLMIYENLLITEADILKSMHEDSAKHIEKTEELLKEFERRQLWFFESFDDCLKLAIERALSDLMPKWLQDILQGDKDA